MEKGNALIVAGINSLLMGLYILDEKSLDVYYMRSVKKNCDKKKQGVEEQLLRSIKLKKNNIKKLHIIDATISEQFSSAGDKDYYYSYPKLQLDFTIYKRLLASSNVIDLMKNHISRGIKIDCIAEGASIVVVSQKSTKRLDKTKLFLKKQLKRILSQLNFKTIFIRKIYLPPSYNDQLLTYFTQKRINVGSVTNFCSVNLIDYRVWCKALLTSLSIPLGIDRNNYFSWYHLSNKRIPLNDYRHWLLQSNRKEAELIIKLHPSDNRNFGKIFPLAHIIDDEFDKLIPAELWNFDDLEYFGWITTSILAMDPKKINLIRVPNDSYYSYSLRTFGVLSEIIDIKID